MIKEETNVQADVAGQATPHLSSSNDTLLRIREAILNRLSGVTSSSTINQLQVSEDVTPAADLAAELKHTLDDLRSSFIDGSGTMVDYEALRESPAYAAYQQECLTSLARFRPDELAEGAARRAFWINLYNALVLDAVITFGVSRSVTEGWLGILAFFRRAAYNVDGIRVSLEDIEQGILRGNRGHPYLPGAQFTSDDRRLGWSLPVEPRIHFALNCASRSCPPVRSYTADKLDAQLDLAARNFVNATTEMEADQSRLVISRIFQWYAADFGGRRSVVDFLSRYLPDDPRREFLLKEGANPRIKYAPYDWRLNTP